MRRLTYILIATLFLGGCHQNVASEEKVDDIHIDDYLFEEVLSASREDFSGYWANQDYLLTMQESMLFIQDRVSGYVNSFDILSEEIIDNILSIQVGDLNQDNSISLISTQDIPLLFEFKEDQLFVSDTKLRSAKFRPLSGEVINERLKLFVHTKGESGVLAYQGPDLSIDDFKGYWILHTNEPLNNDRTEEIEDHFIWLTDDYYRVAPSETRPEITFLKNYDIDSNTLTFTREFVLPENKEAYEVGHLNTIVTHMVTEQMTVFPDDDRAVFHRTGDIYQRTNSMEIAKNFGTTGEVKAVQYANEIESILEQLPIDYFDFEIVEPDILRPNVEHYPYSIGELSEVQLYREQQIIKGDIPHPETTIAVDEAIATLFNKHYVSTSSFYETGVPFKSYQLSNSDPNPILTIQEANQAKLSDEPNPLEIKQVTLEDHIFTVTGQDEETLRFYRLSDDVIYTEDENGQFTKRFEADTDWSDFQNLPRIKR